MKMKLMNISNTININSYQNYKSNLTYRLNYNLNVYRLQANWSTSTKQVYIIFKQYIASTTLILIWLSFEYSILNRKL